MVTELISTVVGNRRRLYFGVGLVTVAAILPLLFQAPFERHILVRILLFAFLGQAWNILGGYCGQLSLGHMVYFGIGAYTSTLLFLRLGVNPWLGMLAGAIVSSLFGVLVGYPTFRLRGRYFVMASIALLALCQTVVLNLDFFGAATGLAMPPLHGSLVNFQFSSKLPYYHIILFLLLVVTAVVYYVDRSKIGYYFRTIQEDEELAASLGIATTRYKLYALAASAFFTAIGGTFYAQYVLFIDPGSAMSLNMSFLVALLVVLGGISTVGGPILGAAILVPLSEIGRAYLGGEGRGLDLVIFAAMIILIGIYQPKGVMGALAKYRRRSNSAQDGALTATGNRRTLWRKS